MEITKIVLYTRGKNRDEFDNPYHAYKAVIHYSYVSYFSTVTVTMPMDWGDSSEWDCRKWALQGIKQALGIEIDMNDTRIEQHHKHVYSNAELEHPENWKC